MIAGQTERYQCNNCMQEFDVILEPKAKEVPDTEKPTDKAAVGYCPFCGEDQIEQV